MTPARGLRQRLDDLAAAAADAVRTEIPGRVTWSIQGIEFAALTNAGAEIHLDHAIADAASRTPDTSIAERGSDWITFAPPDLDPHAVDRLEAWFGLAARMARG